MLNQEVEFRLDHAVTKDDIGDEIAARVNVSVTPADAAAAAAVLALLDESRNASVAERLFVALAGDNNGDKGKELSKKINSMVAVLKAKANSDPVAPSKAAMGSELMSDGAFFALEHALTDRNAAAQFRASYDAMIVAIQAIS